MKGYASNENEFIIPVTSATERQHTPDFAEVQRSFFHSEVNVKRSNLLAKDQQMFHQEQLSIHSTLKMRCKAWLLVSLRKTNRKKKPKENSPCSLIWHRWLSLKTEYTWTMSLETSLGMWFSAKQRRHVEDEQHNLKIHCKHDDVTQGQVFYICVLFSSSTSE